nr:minichromosome maintenance protein MCM [Candidatus Woesearchaeota archaeon]
MLDAREQIERFQEFIESEYKKEIYQIKTTGMKALVIDFRDLAKFDHELSDALLEDPEEVAKAAEICLEKFDIQSKDIRVRFKELPKTQEIKIRNIRSEHINKFFYFDGIVRQSSDVRPQVTSAKFECPSCGNAITILQIDTQFKEPSRCSCGRRGRFRLLNKDLVDVQRLIVEESPETLEGGEQPKRLSVFLKEDLVEPKMERKTTPGSKIRVNGVIKEVAISLKSGVKSTRFDLMADANFIMPIEETFEELNINEEDINKIKEIANDKDVYQKLTNSIAPSIYGNDKIKEAILLQLMGGVKKETKEGTKTRGDMHILLIGDPGSGKSKSLEFVSKIAPKGRLVSGKGVSGVGLTASIVKDEFLRGWALEAGALVLSNGGFVFIDELDKIDPEDTAAMHQALEQQIITISKANVQATLKAETTVLGAANPKYGRFDPYQSVASQINLPPTLINRFDLIFPVRDIPSRERDDKIASHLLRLHQKPEDLKSEIPIDILRKYIAYVRQNIHPKLTNEAINEIKRFYVELRNKPSSGNEEDIKPIPISARQLEALVRLSEASAKVRLSEKVTKEDSKRAIELMKHCLMQVGFDYETGQIDIDRISSGIPASQRSRIFAVREIIRDLEEKVGKSVPMEEIISAAEEKGITVDQVEEVIERLKREGSLYEPKKGLISSI